MSPAEDGADDAARLARVARLPDGRRLGYADLGHPSGKPVFLFHGLPGSRLAVAGDVALAGWWRRWPWPGPRALRILSVDRPGIGLSDPQPGRRLLDWPADVAALADLLGLRRYAVTGGSAGGAYALACAWAHPERVVRAAVVNSSAPPDWPGVRDGLPLSARASWWALRWLPGMPRFAAQAQADLQRDTGRLAERVARGMADEDRARIGAGGELQAEVSRQLAEAFRQGPDGVAQDMRILARPWGFDPREIRVPVDLWQGLADRTVSPAAGRALAAAIPDCRARFLEGEAHLLVRERFEEIAAALAEGW